MITTPIGYRKKRRGGSFERNLDFEHNQIDVLFLQFISKD